MADDETRSIQVNATVDLMNTHISTRTAVTLIKWIVGTGISVGVIVGGAWTTMKARVDAAVLRSTDVVTMADLNKVQASLWSEIQDTARKKLPRYVHEARIDCVQVKRGVVTCTATWPKDEPKEKADADAAAQREADGR